MGGALRLPRYPFRADFLTRLHAKGQQHEHARRKEQEKDRGDRRPLHQAADWFTWTSITSTSGFLPVHAVAQRRTASRTASRS